MPNDAQVLPAAPLETTRRQWLAIVIGTFAAMALAYGACLASALLFLLLIGLVWLARPFRQSAGADATAGAH
jgi:hypothetical protein